MTEIFKYPGNYNYRKNTKQNIGTVHFPGCITGKSI